jgi:MFS family permease
MSLWRSRDLRLVGGARAVSVLGDEIALVALLMRTHDLGLGPFAITGLLVAFAVPTVAVAGLAGRLVDRHDSRTLTLATSLWQASVCLGLAFAPHTGWSGAAATYALVVLLQVGNAVALPTWQALVPEIVGERSLGKAMGDLQALATAAAVVGPAIAGLLVGGPGFTWAMVIDALTFAVLAVAGLAVTVRRRAHHDAGEQGAAARAVGGLALLRADRLLWPLVTGLLALIVVAEGSNVAEVFLVRDTLQASSTVFGYLQAVLAVGLLAGSLVAGRLDGEVARLRSVLLALAGLSLALLVGSRAPSVLVLGACWLAMGTGMAVVNAGVQTLLMQRTPSDQRGRVVAAFMGLARAGSVVALGLGGLSTSLLSPRAVFALGGAAALVAAAVTAARTMRFWRAPAAPR